MIQLIFDSTGEIIPEWENEQERLIFRLAPAGVSLGELLQGRVALRQADAPASDREALGMVVTHYDGDVARQVRVILELPDDAWDDVADRADDLLDQDPSGS
jgi:hypothetical protein